MAITIKSLADAALNSSNSATRDLQYPAGSPPTTNAVVRNIRLANTDAIVSAKVNVTCKAVSGRDTSSPSGTRQVGPMDLVIPPNNFMLLEEEVTLEAGEFVNVNLGVPISGTAKLDVVISGIESV